MKPLLLQTNMAHFSQCSLSFQFHFFSIRWLLLWIYNVSYNLSFFIVSFSFVSHQFSLSLSLLFYRLCLADIVYWYKNNTKARPAHTNYIFSMSIARGQCLAVSVTQLALADRCCNSTLKKNLSSSSSFSITMYSFIIYYILTLTLYIQLIHFHYIANF